MYKHKLFLLPVAWLLAFMALACAPPDDDDAPSSGPSGPAITSASYDVGTALLTVQGTDLSPTEAQIQTITVAGVALSSYTADDDATGVNSNGLEQGKYRIKSDGTALWLRLTDRHKATLNGKVDSNGLKKGLLTSSGAWAGLDTAKDLTVRNIPAAEQVDDQSPKQTEDKQSPKLPEAEQTEEVDDESPKQPKDKQVEQAEEESPKQPKAEDQSPEAAITGATYNVGTALLTVQGSNLSATTATQAQIQTITVDGVDLNSYIADGTATGPDSRGLAKGKYRIKNDGTALWLYLTDTDKATLNGKDGMNTNGLKDGLLSVGTGTWAGLDTAKALAVSGNPAPAITSATYDVGTGELYIRGVKLPKLFARWDFSKLTLVSGDGSNRYTLPRHATAGENTASGSRVGTTYLSITLSGSVKAEAEKILVNDGVRDNNGAYNLEAAAGFAGGSAEDTSNPITVSGYNIISKATYDANTGELIIFGIGKRLPETVAEWDFSKLTLVSGDGSKRYTLPRHATAGENTASGSRVSATFLAITLSGSVKAEAEKILVNDGVRDANGAYNLEAAAEFVSGRVAETSNPITVSGYVSQIEYVLYTTINGQLTIRGTRLPTAVADWDFSKLTLVSGDGSNRYTLPRHSTVGENKATGSSASGTNLVITLSGSVKAEVEKILVKAGFRDNAGAYNLEAAAEFISGSREDLKNAIKVIDW